MKIVAIAALLTTLISNAGTVALAQTVMPAPGGEDEPQTIVGGRQEGQTVVSGWFVSPTFATTGWAGALEYSPGLRGGVYLNRRLAIGLAVNGLANGDSHLGANEGRNFGTYGGLLLQYIVHSNHLVHLTVESTIGDGRWCASDPNNDCSGKRFIVFEPAANLELNVARHVRFTTGVGYRFAVAGSGEGPSSREMSSLVVRSGLLFGSF
jgi:opacity protein-like surface antigen